MNNIKDIAIYGAGGFGREMASLLKRINSIKLTWNFIGFFDDDKSKPKGSINDYGSILGNLHDLNNYSKDLSVILAIGNPLSLKQVYDGISNSKISYPNIVAPEANILDIDNFSMGIGNIICSFSSMSCNVRIKDFNVFNNRVSLGHDVTIGSFNSFMTAVRISGNTEIDTLNFFGVSSVVLPGVKIGKQTRIGASSVVMRKTKDYTCYLGNPAKIFKY